MAEQNPKTLFSSWLDRLQEQSWELELLFSGFTIFGLFKFLDNFQIFFTGFLSDYDTSIDTGISTIAIYLIYVGLRFFLFNLIVHVFLRGLWIGAVGLRYVSGDIDFDQFKFHKSYKKHLKSRIKSFDHYIVILEKLSSVIFSYSFLIFFILFSVVLVMVQITVVDLTLSDKSTIVKTISLWSHLVTNFIRMYFVLALVIAFDFLTLGMLKRIKGKYFVKIYKPIYLFFSYSTLSFLWRPLYYNFIDNKFTRKFVLLLVPYFIIVSTLLSGLKMSSSGYFPDFKQLRGNQNFSSLAGKYKLNRNYYADRIKQGNENGKLEPIETVAISSRTIQGGLLEVFARYDSATEELIEDRDKSLKMISYKGFLSGVLPAESQIAKDLKSKNSALDKQMDSLKTIIDTSENKVRVKQELKRLKLKKKRQDNAVFEQNLIAIKKAITGTFNISIDGNEIKEDALSCDFYEHPNAGEKGLLCTIFLDSTFTKGRHLLEYKKFSLENDKEKSLDSTSVFVPFYYLGQE